MSDQVRRQLSKFFILRMQWWANYACAGGVPIQSGFPTRDRVGIYDSVPGPRVPLLLGIVHDTDAAIDRLPSAYALAVKLFWMREGLSLRKQAEVLKDLLPTRYRRIRHETVCSWVMKGHELLKADFARSRACAAEQEEYEAAALETITGETQRTRVHGTHQSA